MADNQISMPSGMGGLTRYFDESESKILLTPAHVVGMAVALIILELGLRFL